MKSKPFARTFFVPATLVLCFSLVLIAWGEKQTQQTPTQKPTTDTVPKTKTDKKIVDLDEALDELDKTDLNAEIEKAKKEIALAMKEVDAAKIKLEMDKAIRQVNMEKIKAEVEKAVKEVDMQKINQQIKESLKELDAAKMQKEIESSLARVNWNKMNEQLEELKKIDMGKLNDDMVKMQEELKNIGPRIEKEMGKAKLDIEKAKAAIKEYKNFVDELEKDGLINKKENYSIEEKNGELIINGKKQSADVYNKYKEFLEKHKGLKIQKDGDGLNLDKDDD